MVLESAAWAVEPLIVAAMHCCPVRLVGMPTALLCLHTSAAEAVADQRSVTLLSTRNSNNV